MLGFSFFGDYEVKVEVSDAFRSSQRVLAMLGQLSAQAKQYHQILTSFSETIDEYRRQQTRERRVSRPAAVERIFSISSSRDDSGGRTTNSRFSQPTPNFATVDSSTQTGQNQDTLDTMMTLSDVSFNCDQWLPMADDELMIRFLWDNMNSLTEPVSREDDNLLS